MNKYFQQVLHKVEKEKRSQSVNSLISELSGKFPPPCNKYENRPYVKTHISGKKWCSKDKAYTILNNTKNRQTVRIGNTNVNVYVIPKGTVLYTGWHTTRKDVAKKWEDLKLRKSPMFFGNSTTASSYAKKGSEPVIFYQQFRNEYTKELKARPLFHLPSQHGGITKVKTSRDVVLYAIDENKEHFLHTIQSKWNDENFFREAYLAQLKKNKSSLQYYFDESKNWVNALRSTDLNVARISEYSLDEHLVDFVCKLPGIDGWVYTQKNVNKTLNKEIMICRPDESVYAVQTRILMVPTKDVKYNTPSYGQLVRNKKFQTQAPDKREIEIVVNNKVVSRWIKPTGPEIDEWDKISPSKFIHHNLIPKNYMNEITGRKKPFLIE